MPTQNIEDVFRNILHPFMDLLATGDKKSEEEKNKMIESFFDNIKIIKDYLLQKKKEQEEEIIYREEFIRILEYIPQNPKIKELIQKEIELIYFLKKDVLWLDSSYLNICHFEDVILHSEKEEKLQYEVKVIIEELKKEGII